LGVITLSVFVAGCGTAGAERPAPSGDLSGALSEWERAEEAGPASVTVRREAPAPPRETVRIRRPEPRWARVGRPVDVRLERAPLSSALRLLAEAADLGIVIGEGLEAPVTVDLRRVRPVEAMRALAVAHDVELSVVGRTVVARRRR
jgi:hypothetical protein